MFVDFVCDNKECSKFEQVVEKSIPHSEIENQVCEECNEKLRRVWNTNVSIRTSDGIKN